MGKSSKKSATKVDAAPAVVPVSKSGKKGKREAENEIEKVVSAKKQKRDEAVEQAALKKKIEVKTQKKKVESSSDDSDSSSDSEDEKPAPKTVVPAKKIVAAKNGAAKKVESSSSSDDDSSDEDEKKAAKVVPQAKKAPVVVAKKDSSDSSSEEDSDSDEEVKVKNVPASAPKRNSDSESDSSDDEVPTTKTAVPAAKKVQPSKKTEESSEESDESSDESEEEPQAKKAKAPVVAKPSAKTVQKESSSDDSDEESSDDSDEETPKAAPKPTKAPKESSSEEESDSDDESDDEEPSKTPKKKASDVEMVDAATPKTPATSETGSKTLFVGNLPFGVEQSDVENFFKSAGEVADVRIAYNDEGRMKGFGHVEFTTSEAAKKALELNGQELLGRGLRLDLAREKGQNATATPYNKERGSFQQSGGKSNTVYIRGIDTSVGEDEIRSSLQEQFGECGEITRISIPKDYDSGSFKGIAYMDFADSEAFNKALGLDGQNYLKVEEARPRGDFSSGGPRGGGRTGSGRRGRDGGRFSGRRGNFSGGRSNGRGFNKPSFAPSGKKTTFGDDY
ncbi:nucleolin 1 isoform X10 [Humulus lupulus]|uniref:nucleolin 1 isoform X10 n=1 Tax=Humulus lupulus TaxID=3486 RepID=UPI002B407E4B|nr:nucleolin 1 isoform X10 [Humulus lupulus]